MSNFKRVHFAGFQSLWARLAVLMLLTSLSLVVLLTIFYHQTEKRFYHEFARQTTALSKAMQIGLEGSAGGSPSDPMNLEAYLENLNLKGIREVAVINSDNRIIASTNQGNIGKWITQQRKDLIFKAGLGETVTGEGQVFNVIIPMAVEGHNAGYIHLTLSSEGFSVLLRLSAIRRILGAVLILSLGTLLAIILARHTTRPIEAMAAMAGKVAEGDLEQSLPIHRQDEIGQLARSFNEMIVRLREDRQLRERLRTAEHLASTGQFARHIAHEIKNPLNFISLSIDYMGDRFRPTDERMAEQYDSMVVNLKGEVARIGGIAERFLEYGRPFELRIGPCDLDLLLREVLDLAMAQAEASGISILRPTGPLPVLQADPEFLRTCLYNIVKNAFEAMPDGGTLRVEGRVEGNQLTLDFEDSGVGVAPENLDKLFTPLFSTKPDGLGLGLALTRRVIEEHGGKVLFRCEPERGSTLTLVLPVEVK